jgi:L-ascorbate metabolism protein UlaG (beta-lactamase superfamily)
MTFPAAPTASVTFIGNATTLLKFGPITLLTDPNFLHRGQHAYLGYGLTTRRLTEPALTIEELPALDGIVLSHLHGDHWDRVARRGLDHDLPVLTTPHASRRLQWRGFPRATGLRTWTAHEFIRDGYRVRLTALPGRHAPGVLRALLPPVMGSMLEFAPSGGSAVLRLYISGDTLLVDELREIPARFDRIDAALLHLGGTTLPGGLMVTMDGRQGADLFELSRARTAMPIHHSDYRRFASRLEDFTDEMQRRGLENRVTYMQPGVEIPLPLTNPHPTRR